MSPSLISIMRTTNYILPAGHSFASLLGYICPLLLLLWINPAPASPIAESPQVNCSFSPQLRCASAIDGSALWHNSRYSDPDKFSVNATQLFISHSTTSSSYAIQTGAIIWQVSSGSSAHYFYPVLSGETIYLARSDGFLEKRLAISGALLWSQKLADGWVYPPIIQSGQIITGGQDRVIWVLDEQSGQIQERIALKQELVAPLFEAGKLIISSTFDGQLSAFQLNPASNRLSLIWQTSLDAPAFTHLSNAQHLVVADMGGTLHSLKLETGQPRWQKTVHRNALFWNAFYLQNLLSLTDSGSLIILDIDSGVVQSEMKLNRHFIQAPVIQGDTVTLHDITGAAQRLTPDILPSDLGQNSPPHSQIQRHQEDS